jgi:hypothetical protein
MMTNPAQQLMNLHDGDALGNEFVILQVWNPNEEPDTWVRYENIQTEQQYSCRLEAFQRRFSLLPH